MHPKIIRFVLLYCLCLLGSLSGFSQERKPVYSAKYTSVGNDAPDRKKTIIHQVTTSVLAPNISYQTPQVYVLNTPIAALSPANSGGAVPATVYGEASNYASGFTIAIGLAFDAAGALYVGDWGTNQIIKISPGGQRTNFAGSGATGSSDGQGTAASFNTPDALISDAAGNIYVADQANHMIRKITPGGLVSTLAGNVTPGNANGTGTAASFNNPRGMTIDPDGNIYVADQGNNLIRKITAAGVVTTYAGGGTGGTNNVPRLSASFSTPTAVEIDAAGNLYVSESSNEAVCKIGTDGIVTKLATGFVFPRELRIDGSGNIYVADQNASVVKRISPTGEVSTIVGRGFGSGDTFLPSPIGAMLDGKGNLFIGAGDLVKKIVVTGYTINKALPPGLAFDVKTGIITGTPTTLWPATDYTITAYNAGGSSATVVNISVLATAPLKPSIITLPRQQDPQLDANNSYPPGATSTNNEIPITYTSSDMTVAVPTADGLIHLVGPGVTTITAHQDGNANYYPAQPVSQQLTVVEYLFVSMQPIPAKSVCDGDFDTETTAPNKVIPLIFTSSNPAVATVSQTGRVHIVGAGTSVITLSQNANPPLYVSATPASQTLTVVTPQVPSINISANYASPCEGGTITFTAAAQNAGNNPSYQWKVNGNNAGTNSNRFVSSALKSGDIVTCVITNNDDNCVANYPVTSNPVTVTLITPQTPSVSIEASATSVLEGTTITFTATVQGATGTVNYQWFINGAATGNNSAVFESNSFANADVVTCTVTPVAACSTPADSQPIMIYVVQQVTAPNTFTPNADGTNDVWNISGIASYPKCVVSIYNRYGSPVFQSRGYQKPWDGTNKGKQLPAGTYYYVIDLKYKSQRLAGYVTVLR